MTGWYNCSALQNQNLRKRKPLLSVMAKNHFNRVKDFWSSVMVKLQQDTDVASCNQAFYFVRQPQVCDELTTLAITSIFHRELENGSNSVKTVNLTPTPNQGFH
jgi:hypothetical protein